MSGLVGRGEWAGGRGSCGVSGWMRRKACGSRENRLVCKQVGRLMGVVG